MYEPFTGQRQAAGIYLHYLLLDTACGSAFQLDLLTECPDQAH